MSRCHSSRALANLVLALLLVVQVYAQPAIYVDPVYGNDDKPGTAPGTQAVRTLRKGVTLATTATDQVTTVYLASGLFNASSFGGNRGIYLPQHKNYNIVGGYGEGPTIINCYDQVKSPLFYANLTAPNAPLTQVRIQGFAVIRCGGLLWTPEITPPSFKSPKSHQYIIFQDIYADNEGRVFPINPTPFAPNPGTLLSFTNFQGELINVTVTRFTSSPQATFSTAGLFHLAFPIPITGLTVTHCLHGGLFDVFSLGTSIGVLLPPDITWDGMYLYNNTFAAPVPLVGVIRNSVFRKIGFTYTGRAPRSLLWFMHLGVPLQVHNCTFTEITGADAVIQSRGHKYSTHITLNVTDSTFSHVAAKFSPVLFAATADILTASFERCTFMNNTLLNNDGSQGTLMTLLQGSFSFSDCNFVLGSAARSTANRDSECGTLGLGATQSSGVRIVEPAIAQFDRCHFSQGDLQNSFYQIQLFGGKATIRDSVFTRTVGGVASSLGAVVVVENVTADTVEPFISAQTTQMTMFSSQRLTTSYTVTNSRVRGRSGLVGVTANAGMTISNTVFDLSYIPGREVPVSVQWAACVTVLMGGSLTLDKVRASGRVKIPPIASKGSFQVFAAYGTMTVKNSDFRDIHFSEPVPYATHRAVGQLPHSVFVVHGNLNMSNTFITGTRNGTALSISNHDFLDFLLTDINLTTSTFLDNDGGFIAAPFSDIPANVSLDRVSVCARPVVNESVNPIWCAVHNNETHSGVFPLWGPVVVTGTIPAIYNWSNCTGEINPPSVELPFQIPFVSCSVAGPSVFTVNVPPSSQKYCLTLQTNTQHFVKLKMSVFHADGYNTPIGEYTGVDHVDMCIPYTDSRFKHGLLLVDVWSETDYGFVLYGNTSVVSPDLTNSHGAVDNTFLGLGFGVTGVGISVKLNVTDQFTRPVVYQSVDDIPQDDRIVLQFEGKNYAPISVIGTNTLLFQVTPRGHGKHDCNFQTLSSLSTAEMHTRADVTVIHIEWMYASAGVVALLVLIAIVIMVTMCVRSGIKFVREKRRLEEDVSIQMKLLAEYQREGPAQIHHTFLADYETSSQPAALYLDPEDKLHVLCECPGHWHVVRDKASWYVEDPSALSASLPYLTAVREAFDEAVIESGEGTDALERLTWSPQLELASLDESILSSIAHDPELSQYSLEDGGAPNPAPRTIRKGRSSKGGYSKLSNAADSTDAADSSMDTSVDASQAKSSSYGHHHLQMSRIRTLALLPVPEEWRQGLVHVRLASGQMAWVCNQHAEEQKLTPKRPFELPNGCLNDMSPVSEKMSDLNVLEISVNDPMANVEGTYENELISLVQSELGRLGTPDGKVFVLSRIKVYQQRSLEEAFIQRYNILSQEQRAQLRKPWPKEDAHSRGVVSRELKRHLRRVPKSSHGESSRVNLDLVWHGPRGGEAGMESIARLGFINLALQNSGWYGRGLYSTHWPDYAEYYASQNGRLKDHISDRGEKMLMLCWVLLGQVFPVTERLDEVRDKATGEVVRSASKYHGGYPGHDSHYVLVRRGGKPCIEFSPAPKYSYDEVVVWQENQILPKFVVYYTTHQATTSGEKGDNAAAHLRQAEGGQHQH